MSHAAYTAAGVRACALRTLLLDPDEWRTLRALPGSAAAVEWLRQRGIVRATVSTVLAAERDGHDAVIRSATGLLRFARAELADLLRGFLRYYDLLNVESLVFGMHAFPDAASRPAGRFYNTGPFGLLRTATLQAVTNYPALGRALRHSPLASAYESALVRYQEDEDVVRMVESLEIAFFASWVGAAERCGMSVCSAREATVLRVFFAVRAAEAAVRLKRHRQAAESRVVEWLSLVGSEGQVRKCLSFLAAEQERDPARAMLTLLLPDATIAWANGGDGDPLAGWGWMDRIVMQAALKATRGIRFDAEFLAAILVRQVYQARALTVLLESKDANLSLGAGAKEGARA